MEKAQQIFCAGCGAKLGAGVLREMLKNVGQTRDENLIVGFETGDDGCVYKLTEELAVIQTVDFFPPPCDDPYLFGQIAAANALSDIYAMGGIPKTAMNLLAVPREFPKEYTKAVLEGGLSKISEAECTLAGGHSIYDISPKYGLSVMGTCHPDRIMRNNTGRQGDAIFLTKSLGTGMLISGYMGEIVDKETMNMVYKSMAKLNRYDEQMISEMDISACTDVTGFGFLGHLSEMMGGKGMSAIIDSERIPVLSPIVQTLSDMGFVPQGTYSNKEFCSGKVHIDEKVPRWMRDVLYDPQTSGGLMMFVAQKDAEKAERYFGIKPVGHVENMGNAEIIVR